jgi:hypothetical protein
MIGQEAKLAVFRAQVTNVRSLDTALKQVKRTINAALRSGDRPATQAFTRVQALLVCAWAEANFSKVIHTPYGLDLGEIDQIKQARDKGIAEAWKLCVRLGLNHLEAKRGSFRPNALQRLNSAIDAHVFEPSVLRNKLAHGQWEVALNRDNDAVQNDLTQKIVALDCVAVESWKVAHMLLAQLVEHLIESPKKAFMRDWYSYVVEMEQHMVAAERRTIQEHVKRLHDKDERTGALSSRKVGRSK